MYLLQTIRQKESSLSDDGVPEKLSHIPPGSLVRIEITVMPGGLIGVNIGPDDTEMAVAVMAAAIDLYGYNITVEKREDGMPSESIELLSEHHDDTPILGSVIAIA